MPAHNSAGSISTDAIRSASPTPPVIDLRGVPPISDQGSTTRSTIPRSPLSESDLTAYDVPAPSSARPPRELNALLLIAQRAALESLRDRLTRLMNVFFALVAPLAVLVLVIRPMDTADPEFSAAMLPFYLMVIGMLPAVGAVGIAAGQFAGENERGVLGPLLAAPVSNVAIFGGKVLGSVAPPLVYAAIAISIYLLGLVVLLGPSSLASLPLSVSIATLLLVPISTCLAAIVGALVSSRVRTFNAAQQIAGIILVPVWGLLFTVALRLPDWGVAGMFAAVGGLLVLDVVLTAVAAQTWRREEVLSQR
jgi:ABC-type transport system involved in multi-copper enzyme maturation permease subunit